VSRVVLVPGVLALLPEYAGLSDPVVELRAACVAAVAWLVQDGSPVTVLADSQGARVAASLLGSLPGSLPGHALVGDGSSYLVVGNGSACRTEKAPGHLDDRSFAFDDALESWLRGGGALPALDLAGELQASVAGFRQLAAVLAPGEPVVDYIGDPFGVQYWVMRWETA
jgi:hypothetical protein